MSLSLSRSLSPIFPLSGSSRALGRAIDALAARLPSAGLTEPPLISLSTPARDTRTVDTHVPPSESTCLLHLNIMSDAQRGFISVNGFVSPDDDLRHFIKPKAMAARRV